MKVFHETEDQRLECPNPPEDRLFVTTPLPCSCGSNRIRSSDQNLDGKSTVTGSAYCFDCERNDRGILIVELDTLFGLDEDERVLRSGRYRVY